MTADPLLDEEMLPGVAIDPSTQTAREGHFFTRHVLRLRAGVTMAAWARARDKANDSQPDAMSKWLDESDGVFPFGGEGGTVRATAGAPWPFGDLEPPSGVERMAWVLLTPAVFVNRLERDDPAPRGWLPGWAGRGGTDSRGAPVQPGTACFPDTRGARLVAACVPRPLAFSGWDSEAGGPKATRLAVPAGAVYLFEGEPASLSALATRLHGPVPQRPAWREGFRPWPLWRTARKRPVTAKEGTQHATSHHDTVRPDPVHVGAGNSVGAIDAPIMRERHTRFPMIPGSSLKGVLADLGLKNSTSPIRKTPCAPRDPRCEACSAVMTQDKAAAGSLVVGEGRLLAFPCAAPGAALPGSSRPPSSIAMRATRTDRGWR